MIDVLRKKQIQLRINKEIKELQTNLKIRQELKQCLLQKYQVILGISELMSINGPEKLRALLDELPRDIDGDNEIILYELVSLTSRLYQRSILQNFFKLCLLFLPIILVAAYALFNQTSFAQFQHHFQQFVYYRSQTIISTYKRFEQPFLEKHQIISKLKEIVVLFLNDLTQSIKKSLKQLNEKAKKLTK